MKKNIKLIFNMLKKSDTLLKTEKIVELNRLSEIDVPIRIVKLKKRDNVKSLNIFFMRLTNEDTSIYI